MAIGPESPLSPIPEYTKTSTNSLRIRLPSGLAAGVELTNLGRLLKSLESFGDVSRLDLTPDSEPPSAVVSYFDVRAAARALEALGDCCERAPQHGERTLRLGGEVSLEPTILPEVADVRPSGVGDFLVEFFDTRVAAKMAGGMEGRKKSGKAEDRSEQQTLLQLRGLPCRLCMPGMLERLLEMEGLLPSVSSVRAHCREGKRLGCAILEAKSVEDVPKLAKFFHGRQFGASMPVSVGFARGGAALARLPCSVKSAIAEWCMQRDLCLPARLSEKFAEPQYVTMSCDKQAEPQTDACKRGAVRLASFTESWQRAVST